MVYGTNNRNGGYGGHSRSGGAHRGFGRRKVKPTDFLNIDDPKNARRDVKLVLDIYENGSKSDKAKAKQILKQSVDKVNELAKDPLFTENVFIDAETGRTDLEDMKDTGKIYEEALKKLS